MVSPSKLPKRRLQGVLICIRVDAEHLIVVRGHRQGSLSEIVEEIADDCDGVYIAVMACVKRSVGRWGRTTRQSGVESVENGEQFAGSEMG